jgi:hypothetical protein
MRTGLGKGGLRETSLMIEDKSQSMKKAERFEDLMAWQKAGELMKSISGLPSGALASVAK